MSLRWDDIDNRNQKSKQQAKELKDYLIAQHEESKKRFCELIRKQKEKENERESFRKIILGQTNGKYESASGASDMGQKSTNQKPSVVHNPVQMLTNSIPDIVHNAYIPDYIPSKSFNSEPTSSDDYQTRTLAEDYKSRLRIAEDQLFNDKLTRNHQDAELQNSKYLLGSMSVKIEQLQEQARKESQQLSELANSFHQRDRESRKKIESLSNRLESETLKVQALSQELSRKSQRQDLSDHKKEEYLKGINERIEFLNQKLELSEQRQNQVGFSLSSTSKELMMESQRNNDTMNTIKQHEKQLVTLSSVVDSSAETFARRMQQAAQDLCQKIEAEGKSRRKLEESIRTDAVEFRKFIERQVNEKVDSLHTYTMSKQEADRQEFESIANALQTKLQKLEITGADSQEQLVSMINQRFQLIETTLIESEKNHQKTESRLQQALADSLSTFESLIMKKEIENEKRYSHMSKSLMQNQRAISDSIGVSEKSVLGKFKSLEDVVRAEIKSRLDLESRVALLSQDTRSAIDSHQQQFGQLSASIQNLQEDHDKVLELVKVVTEQMTKAQDRWISNFEGEVAKLNESLKNQSSQTKQTLQKAQSEMLHNQEEFMMDFQGKLLDWEAKFQDEMGKHDLLESSINAVDSKLANVSKDFEQRVLANSIQFDSTLEALKLELTVRPTHAALQTKVDGLNESLDSFKEEITQELSSFKENNLSAINQEMMNDIEKNHSSLRLNFETKLKSIEVALSSKIDRIQQDQEDQTAESVRDLNAQLKSIAENLANNDQTINDHIDDLDHVKTMQNEELDKRLVLEQALEQNEQHLRDLKALFEQRNSQQDNLKKDLCRLDEDFTTTTAEIRENFNIKFKETNGNISKNAEAISKLKSQWEKAMGEHKTQLRESLTISLATQKQAFDETHCKAQEYASRLDEKIESTNHTLSKVSQMLEMTSSTKNREIESLKNEIAQSKDEFESNFEKYNAIKSDQESTNEQLRLNIQALSIQSDKTANDLADFTRKTSSHEQVMQNRINELMNLSHRDAEAFISQIRSVNDTLNKNKQQTELKIRDLQNSSDTNGREIRSLNMKHIQSSAETQKLQTKLSNLSDLRADESISIYVEPLTARIEMLAEHLDRIETTMYDQREVQPSQILKPVSASVYKLSPIDSGEKSNSALPRNLESPKDQDEEAEEEKRFSLRDRITPSEF